MHQTKISYIIIYSWINLKKNEEKIIVMKIKKKEEEEEYIRKWQHSKKKPKVHACISLRLWESPCD